MVQEVIEKPVKPVKESSASCEKAIGNACGGATEKCFEPVFVEGMRTDPARRWIDCYQWKVKLGMVFDRDLGVYILPEWKEELMKKAGLAKPFTRFKRLAKCGCQMERYHPAGQWHIIVLCKTHASQFYGVDNKANEILAMLRKEMEQ